MSVRRTARVRLIVVLAACGTMFGCSAQRVRMHPGPDLPAAQTATITATFDRFNMMVTLETIDGAIVPNQGPIRGGIYSRQTTAVVAPGVHIVEVKFWGDNGGIEQYDPYPITFLSEGGHDYEIRIERDPIDPDSFMAELRKSLAGGHEFWLTYVFDATNRTAVPIQSACYGPPQPMSVAPIRRSLRVYAQPIVIVIL